jgi:hypothetical protein
MYQQEVCLRREALAQQKYASFCQDIISPTVIPLIKARNTIEEMYMYEIGNRLSYQSTILIIMTGICR